MKKFLTVLLLLTGISPLILSQTDISVHDPVVIRQDNLYYVFCTGNGISVFSSPDMVNWTRQKQVFEKAPEWVFKKLPGFRNSMWAPDISFENGFYYLYYSVSAFGKNTSCIGLARNKTLKQDSPDYNWEDLGCVIQSVPGRDHWNAIDPNFIAGADGTPWLVFGSFWDGIKLVRLNEDLKSIFSEPQEWHTVARRFRDPYTDDGTAGSGQIEAPFLFKKGNYYYLFVSWDKCCSGVNSTYKVVVGRSPSITGPYLARDSTDMAKGGGTIVVQGNEKYPGVGHQAVVNFDGTDFLVYHGYDAGDNGRSKLLIRKILWDIEGWPTVNN
ncbi:MAG TPA: arabinan endo-1,5-alpha-L-arabinosidase [Bacteroidales bacterium]|nr:arabinan endo-1,5-alpha-L-arabinosidase [Bacteroidales bacterium]